MNTCDICGVKLHSNEGLLARFWELLGYKHASVIVVMDQSSMTSFISTVCEEDMKWIEKNPDPAEAIYKNKLLEEGDEEEEI